MLSINDIKLGTTINYKGYPYLVIYAQHVKMGRGGANLKTKLKNLITGQNLEITFSGADKIEEAQLENLKASFLYKENEDYHFMYNDTYEQFSLNKEVIGTAANFLKEGMNVDVLVYENKPVTVKLPVKVALKVTQSPPAIKGDTAGSASKLVTMETDRQIKVPLFIKEGEIIKINTETGEYIERVN
ncbi:elongation factor P [Patescibacteria group bacterium]|nr:elongation factor P [Patescibacteria group bacterium]